MVESTVSLIYLAKAKLTGKTFFVDLRLDMYIKHMVSVACGPFEARPCVLSTTYFLKHVLDGY